MNPFSAYHTLTEGLVASLDVSHPMMHVNVGLAIYFAAQLVLRDRRASVLGLAWVAFAELANEIIEFGYYGSWRWSDTMGDIVATLFWPAMIVVMGLYRRRRWPVPAAVVSPPRSTFSGALFGFRPRPAAPGSAARVPGRSVVTYRSSGRQGDAQG